MRNTLILMLMIASSILNAQEWKAELLRNIIVMQGDKMTATDLTMITTNFDGNSMQVKSYAEAPANSFISRDQFVALFSTTVYVLIEAILEEGGLTHHDYKMKTLDIDDLIGTADIEITIYMGKNGMQLVMKVGTEENKITQTWETIFE